MPAATKPADRHRLIAGVLNDLVRTTAFESLADLVDALKARLSRLLIRWTNDEVIAACRLVGSNTTLVRDPYRSRGDHKRPEGTLDPSRKEAAALLALHKLPVPQMPSVTGHPKAR